MAVEYSEFRCYSPLTDGPVSRISMADSHGMEFWMEVEGEGKAYREAKAQALEDLMEAIAMGLEPGKVVRG
jgi:hypothetical protein